MQHNVSIRLFLISIILIACPALLISQAVIKERVEIKPTQTDLAPAASGMQSSSLQVTFLFSFEGDLRTDKPRFMRYKNYFCGYDLYTDPMGNGSTLVVPAVGGYMEAYLRFSTYSGGKSSLSMYLGDFLLTSFPYTAPGNATVQIGVGTTFYSAMNFGFNSTLPHGQQTGIWFPPGQPSQPCSRGILWHPSLPTTLTITEGGDLGAFFNTHGDSLGLSVTGTQDQLTQTVYRASGNQPQGDAGTATIVATALGQQVGTATLTIYRTQKPLDHFLVRLSKDTVGYNETSIFTVIAQDEDNNELVLDGNTTMRFSVDSAQFGSYIVNSERIPTQEVQVMYGVARAQGVRYIADGLNPITLGPRTINFHIYNEGEYSRGGLVSLTIYEKAVITLAFDKKELTPLGDGDNKKLDPNCKSKPDTCRRVIDFSKVSSCSLAAKVTDRSGNGVAGYPLTIRPLVRDYSGGHDHNANRPTGRFVTSKKDTVTTYQGATDSEGQIQIKYLCSGFGGIDSIHARGATLKDTATTTIVIRVSQLDSLCEGIHYHLVGSKPTHEKNHFGATRTIANLKMLADSAYADSSWILQYNDISLIYGGPFDVSRTPNWDTPHQTHRQGRNTDVRPTSLDGRLLDPDRIRFVVQRQLKGAFLEEAKGEQNHHFHLTF